MADLRKWSDVKVEIRGGLIAMVTAESPDHEQRLVVNFSNRTKYLLCRPDVYGIGKPYLENWQLNDPHWAYHVFAAVMDDRIAGYAICEWRKSGLRNSDGKPLGVDGQVIAHDPLNTCEYPMSIRELKRGVDCGEPNSQEFEELKCWGVSGVAVLKKFQRRGIGCTLLQTAASSLGVKLEQMAFENPILHAGEALLNSLGLSKNKMIYWG